MLIKYKKNYRDYYKKTKIFLKICNNYKMKTKKKKQIVKYFKKNLKN